MNADTKKIKFAGVFPVYVGFTTTPGVSFPLVGKDIFFPQIDFLKDKHIKAIKVVINTDSNFYNLKGEVIVPLNLDIHSRITLSIALKQTDINAAPVYLFKNLPIANLSDTVRLGKDFITNIAGADLGECYVTINGNTAGMAGNRLIFQFCY